MLFVKKKTRQFELHFLIFAMFLSLILIRASDAFADGERTEAEAAALADAYCIDYLAAYGDQGGSCSAVVHPTSHNTYCAKLISGTGTETYYPCYGWGIEIPDGCENLGDPNCGISDPCKDDPCCGDPCCNQQNKPGDTPSGDSAASTEGT